MDQRREDAIYSVRWNSRDAMGLNTIHKFLESQSLTDVYLACGGSVIKSHRIILAASSSYFEQLFTQHCLSVPLVVVLKDILMTDLRAILTFIYKGEVFLNERDIAGFLKVAAALKIKGLVKEGNQVSAIQSSNNKESSIHEVLLKKCPLKSSATEHCKRTLPANQFGSLISIPEENGNDVTMLNAFKESSQTFSNDPAISTNMDSKGEEKNKTSQGKPRKYKRYPKEKLLQALKAVGTGISCLTASKQYGIPARTLYEKSNQTKKRSAPETTETPKSPPLQKVIKD